jgi:hypothetical protein
LASQDKDKGKRMKRFFLSTIVTMLLLTACIGHGANQLPPLQMPRLSAEYSKRRDQVLPNPSEKSYRKMPWRNSVLHGIVDAQKQDKPVMIVLMNGHPLGCT